MLALATWLKEVVFALSNVVGLLSQFIGSHCEYKEFDDAKYNSLPEELLFDGIDVASGCHILDILDHLLLQLLLRLLELDLLGANKNVGPLIARELIHGIDTSRLVHQQLTLPLPRSLSLLRRLLLLKPLHLSLLLIDDGHVLQECLMAVLDVAISQNNIICQEFPYPLVCFRHIFLLMVNAFMSTQMLFLLLNGLFVLRGEIDKFIILIVSMNKLHKILAIRLIFQRLLYLLKIKPLADRSTCNSLP